MSRGTARPTASLKSAIDFAISRGVVIVTSAGNRGPDGMGWPGAFPQVISADAIGWTRDGPSRLGVGSSRMSSREMPTRALSRISVPASFRPAVRSRCAGHRSVLSRGCLSPGLSRTFGARLFQARPRLLRRVLGGTAGRRSSWKLPPRKPARTVTGLRCTFAVDPALWSIPAASASAKRQARRCYRGDLSKQLFKQLQLSRNISHYSSAYEDL